MRALLEFLCIIFFFHAQLITSFSSSLSLSSSPPSSSVVGWCPHEQSIALLQFKNMLSTDVALDCDVDGNVSYPKTDSWKEGVDCCLWDGVTCDHETGNVIGLDLSCSWLRGTIGHSNNSLFHLSHLQKLNLAYNDFEQSRISPEFGLFSSLTHLNLSSSMFSGKLSFGRLSNLSRLVSLDVSENIYLEPESTSMWSSLAQNLTNLEELSLHGIDMSSVSPHFLMNLSSSMTSLNLARTNMLGDFPAAYILHLRNLQYLNLNSNLDLSGLLPESNWSTSLRFLDLGICNFTGLLPTSIGSLAQITYIDLSFNKLGGTIPSSFSQLAKLEYLSLAENNFQGRIPNYLFNNMSKLTYVSLVRNNFISQLPSSIFNLPEVSCLALQHNSFVGPFPEFAKGLTKLVSLDLSSNSLVGV